MAELHGRLLAQAALDPARFRSVPAKASPILETITRVLERAGRPLRACEVHAAAEGLVGVPLLWSSVKGTLAGHSTGVAPCFRRVSRGVYELAR